MHSIRCSINSRINYKMSLTNEEKINFRVTVCQRCLKQIVDPGSTPEQVASARKELFSVVKSLCPTEAKAWKDKPKAKPKPKAPAPPAPPEAAAKKGNALVVALPKVKAPKISLLAKISIFGWSAVVLFLYWVFSNMDKIEQMNL